MPRPPAELIAEAKEHGRREKMCGDISDDEQDVRFKYQPDQRYMVGLYPEDEACELLGITSLINETNARQEMGLL